MVKAVERPQRAPANPFRRKRRANGSTRFLNKRQAAAHPSFYDRAGNPATGVTK